MSDTAVQILAQALMPEDQERASAKELNRAHNLIEAITPHIILENKEPFLGLATTKHLIEELKSRGEVDPEKDEWYTTPAWHGPMYQTDTGKSLVDELYYRAHFAETNGASWPGYRTVDGGFSVNVDVHKD